MPIPKITSEDHKKLKVEVQTTKHLQELFEIVMHAEQHFQIYEVLVNSDDRAKFEGCMNRFAEFFQPTIKAHLEAIIMSLWCIYDNDDHISIQRVLQETSQWIAASAAISNFKKRVMKMQSTTKKIYTIRHNVLAHRSVKLTPEKAFERAAVSRRDLRQLIDGTKILINEIGELIGWHGTALFDSAASTRNLLNTLQQVAES